MSELDNSIEAFAARRSERDSLLYPSIALAEAMIRSSLDRSVLRRLLQGSPLALIVLAPYPEAVPHLADALDRMSAESARILHTTSIRGGRNLFGVAGAAGGIAAVHVTADISEVPPAFRILAEAVIHVPAPDGPVLRKAMAKCCVGRPPKSVEDLDIGRLDWRLVCALMPRGGSASASARAFERVLAAENEDQIPTLEESVEYGEARTWGMSLKLDLAAWRAGEIGGDQLRSAILLSGEPGVGKSYFAKILAKSLGVRLVVFGVGELFRNGGYLNETLKTLREAFSAAAASPPGVLFLDELDSFPMRGSGERNDAYFNALVNELLLLLDSSSRPAGLVVVGATNRPEEIDPAITRSGRLSTHVAVTLPDRAGIEHVMRVHLGADLVDASLANLSLKAVGATPADLAEWIKAARSVARQEARPLRIDDIEGFMTAGDRRTPEEKYRIAVHEIGHVLADRMIDACRLPSFVSIVARGQTLGQVGHAPIGSVLTEQTIGARVRILLGGLAAEELVFGRDLGAGAGGAAGSDLERATMLVTMMIGSLGFRGNLLYRGADKELFAQLRYDPSMRAAAERELKSVYAEVKNFIHHRRRELDVLACALAERGVLTAEEVKSVADQAAHGPRMLPPPDAAEESIQVA
ncbi:MAG: AAA family ATPase [Candidatus Devosia phytovorans]|uniref:AAA family ATPase n=1 Tax=Candidatus Devosia phytovorans TaxID=3121372 RepID=A0AAJ6AZ96_9HYPH|nr:AAA family ATPase [Devosia sp.]WEK03877.1 MAG: AAA family ATPase [Devosia sp.]